MKDVVRDIWCSIKLYLFFFVVIGCFYVMGLRLVGAIFWHEKSMGSLLYHNGSLRGSSLIGQHVSSSLKLFHGRPKFNLFALEELPFYFPEILFQIKNIENHSIHKSQILYGEMITSSYSQLDPYVTYEAALAQVLRVSKYSGIKPEILLLIINANTTMPLKPFYQMKKTNITKVNYEILRIIS